MVSAGMPDYNSNHVFSFSKDSPNTAEALAFASAARSSECVPSLAVIVTFWVFFFISLLKKLAHVEFPRTNDVESCSSLSVGWLARAQVSLSAQKGMEGAGRGKEDAS